jgi:hypothetical protein
MPGGILDDEDYLSPDNLDDDDCTTVPLQILPLKPMMTEGMTLLSQRMSLARDEAEPFP